MDKVVSILLSLNFKRIFVDNSSDCLIVHAVPGAGKTFAIQEILRRVRGAICLSLGPPFTTSLEALPFYRVGEPLPDCKVLIIDEYQLGFNAELKPKVCFGDPCQFNIQSLRPNFIKDTTERFGQSTCSFLNSLGFSISSSKVDTFSIGKIFEADLCGSVLCFEKEVEDLLKSHNCEYFTPETCLGKTFESCTAIFGHTKLLPCVRHLAFVCLTRHKSSLLLLTPDGTYTTT